MGKEISLLIKGTNYEKVSESEISIQSETVSDDLKSYILDENNSLYIIEKFLEQMDKKGVVNTAIGKSKKDKNPSLWTPILGGNSLYGGVAGVIEDSLDIKREEDFEGPIDTITGEELDLTISIRLEIRTRFDEKSLFFLATLLLRDKIILNDNRVFSNEEDLYDYMLLFWYKIKLSEAFEKGFYKTYRRFEANNDRIKGTIDISRHIRLNAGQSNGKIAYSHRENTVNNFLNHMIVVAYECLKKKYPELVEQNFDNNIELRGIIEAIKSEIGYELINSQQLIKQNNRVIAHPYFMEYEDLRVICIRILRNEGISIWDADDEKTKSILFYVPDLWELFLEDKINEKKELAQDLFSQGKTPDKDESVFVYGEVGSKESKDYSQATYPDFVFFDMSDDKSPYCIIDAKFRKGLGNSMSKGDGIPKVELDDYTKCIRDMNSLNVHATGVIFPVNDTLQDQLKEEQYSHGISKYNDQDIFYTFPVVIPKEEDGEEKTKTYSTWRKEFEESVNHSMGILAEKVQREKKYAKKVREFMQGFPRRG